MHAFGISNHSPQQTIAFLRAFDEIKSEGDVAIVPSGTILKEKKPTKLFLFIISIQDFFKNAKVLNSQDYKDAQVFVFASPLRIRELKNCVSLDTEPSQEAAGLIVRLKHKLDRNAYKKGLKESVFDVRRQDTKFLTSLIENIKQGSLLNPLMTFIYTLPSSTHQTPIKQLCAAYFYEGLSFEKLEAKIAKIKDITISEKVVARMKEILTSDIGNTYKKFFKEYKTLEVKGKVSSLESMCKKAGTSPYEVRYLLSVSEEAVRRGKSKGKSIQDLNKLESAEKKAKKLVPIKAKVKKEPKPKVNSKAKVKAGVVKPKTSAKAIKKKKKGK